MMLADLVRGNLLIESAPGRHRLHDLLRAYAAKLCRSADAQQRDAARLRLLDHYLHSACAAGRVLQPLWDPVTPKPPAPGVSPEVPVDHPGALAWFRTELAVLLPLVGWAAERGFDAHAAQLALALATFLTPNCLWRELMQTQLVARDAAHRFGDLVLEGRTSRLLSRAYTRLGHHDRAAAPLDRALALFEQAGAEDWSALVHHNYAEMHQRLGRPQDALAHSQEAERLYRATGNRIGEARARNGVGYCYAVIGNYRKALRCCRAAAAVQEQLGDRDGLAATYTSIAFAHQQLGAYQEAERGFLRALRLFEAVADRHQLGETWHQLGDCRHAAGDLDAARAAWRQALTILEERHDPAVERVRGKLDRPA